VEPAPPVKSSQYRHTVTHESPSTPTHTRVSRRALAQVVIPSPVPGFLSPARQVYTTLLTGSSEKKLEKDPSRHGFCCLLFMASTKNRGHAALDMLFLDMANRASVPR
jgi:hypothetical protein